MARATIPLAVGRGMDRATGTVAVQPNSPVDTQNVYARDAQVALRPGLGGTQYPPLPWGTDLIAIVPVKATGDELFCVYDRVSRQLRIYRLDPAGPTMQPLSSPPNGLWGTLLPSADFPVVTAAEGDGAVMFAHDEGSLFFRLNTIYYTPDFGSPDSPGTLTVLEADLDGDGVSGPVFFRGVLSYLDYMVGFGYGSESDEDRGDIGRLSLPTQPTVFSPENYFIAGAKKDPIRGLVPTSDSTLSPPLSVLAIGKENEAYKLVGSSPDDFGVELLDARYGCVSSRCTANIGGVGYWWSIDGARRVTPGGTQPIAQPLQLISPLPADFPALGPSRTCFAVYDRRRYVLEWLFPTLETAAARTPAFALSLWNPNDPRWTFFVREQCLASAGEIFVSDDAQPPAPTGYANAVTAEDVGIAADARFRSVTVNWTNNGAVGDEIVQIFARPEGGDWSLALSVPVGGPTQSASLETLLPLTQYGIPLTDFGIAVKYVAGLLSTAGYAGTPDDWTAATKDDSQTTVETSSEPVTWVGGTFVNAATPINLVWSSAQLGVPYLLEKNAGAGFVTVASGLVATTYPYPIPPVELGTTVTFRVTAETATVVGPVAVPDLDVPMFITIGTPTWVSGIWNPATGQAALTWNAASLATSYLLEKTNDGGATWSPVAVLAGTTFAYTVPIGEYNTTVGFRVTGQAGSSSGPHSTTENVTFTLVLAAPVATSATFQSAGVTGSTTPNRYGTVQVIWNAVASATSYFVEQSFDGGATWSSAGTTSGTSLGVTIPPSRINQTIEYRVTARRGGVPDSAPSNIVSATTTYAITAAFTSISPTGGGHVTFTWTGPSPASIAAFDSSGNSWLGTTGAIASGSPQTFTPGTYMFFLVAAGGTTNAISLPNGPVVIT